MSAFAAEKVHKACPVHAIDAKPLTLINKKIEQSEKVAAAKHLADLKTSSMKYVIMYSYVSYVEKTERIYEMKNNKIPDDVAGSLWQLRLLDAALVVPATRAQQLLQLPSSRILLCST